MAILNPAKILRERKNQQVAEREACASFDARLIQLLGDKEQRKKLTHNLKNKSVNAKDLFLASQQLLRDKEETKRWIEGRARDYGFKYLSDVTEKGSTFFRVIIVVREMIAEDIQAQVRFTDGAHIVLQRLFR